MDQIENRERHRRLLLKALYKSHNPNRSIQDLGPAFDDAGPVFEPVGLTVAEGMAAAQYLVDAGMLKWHSDQQPGLVQLLHPGVQQAERIITTQSQATRLAFMRRAYGVVDGSTIRSFKWETVGKDIGLDDRDAALQVVLYLVEKGLIKNESLASYHLTQPGADEVEQSMADEHSPTAHLPAATTSYHFLVEGGVHAPFQLQQGSPGAAQSQHVVTLQGDERQLVETFMQEYRQQLATSNPNEEALAQVNEHLANIEEELESAQPDRGVIEKAMQTLKLVGVGIGVNLTTQGIVAAFNHFL